MSRLSPSGDSGFIGGVGGDLSGARPRVLRPPVLNVHSKSPGSGPKSPASHSVISKALVVGLYDEPMTVR